MKCIILFGSPREQGNTAALLEPFLEELNENGVETSFFNTYKLNVGGCKACLYCQQDEKKAICIQNDDMQKIYSETVDSDAIIIATPIYGWFCPAPLKAILDRYVYANCKYYGDNPHGPSLLFGKKLYIIATCGYPIEKGTDLFEEGMKRYCKHCQMEYGGIFAVRQRNLKEAFMDKEKEIQVKQFAEKLILSIK